MFIQLCQPMFTKKKLLFLRIAFGHFTLRLFFVFVFTQKNIYLVDPWSMIQFQETDNFIQIEFFPRRLLFFETIYYNLKYIQIAWICLGVFGKLFNEQFNLLFFHCLSQILKLIFVFNTKKYSAVIPIKTFKFLCK